MFPAMLRKISGYILSLLLLILSCANATAQEVELADTSTGLRTRGPRIGVDIASLALLYFEPERMVYSLSIDYEYAQDIYPAAELGFQTVSISRPEYNYKSTGWFTRLGTDVNLLKYEGTDIYEMMYAGFRYGFSRMRHEASGISIEDLVYGDFTVGSIPQGSINTHFISLVGGVRVELARNFFMGWSVFMNIRFYQSGAEGMDPYNIPGFGKGANRVTVTFNYTVSYRIPMQQYTPKIKAGKK